MKKKKLLKRIEELESSLQYERKKYKDLLLEDDKETIDVKRLEYKIKEDIEHCFFFGLSSDVTIIDEPIHFKTIANGDFKIPIIKKYEK